MAGKGNKNAAKPAEEKADDHMHLRCRKQDKERWSEAAESQDLSLAGWVTKVLNEEAKKWLKR